MKGLIGPAITFAGTLSVYNLRIYLNSSVWMSNPKINLSGWKSTPPDQFFTNIYILILNNCIESFNNLADAGRRMLKFF